MKKMIFTVLAVALATLPFGTALLAADEQAPQEPKYMSISVKKLEGGSTTLKEVLGKKDQTLLVFFNTSCGACRNELDDLMKNYAGKGNLEIVGVSVDVRAEQVKKYRDEAKIPFAILSDPEYAIPGNFEISFTPASILFDKSGKVIGKFLGYNAQVKGKMEAALK